MHFIIIAVTYLLHCLCYWTYAKNWLQSKESGYWYCQKQNIKDSWKHRIQTKIGTIAWGNKIKEPTDLSGIIPDQQNSLHTECQGQKLADALKPVAVASNKHRVTQYVLLMHLWSSGICKLSHYSIFRKIVVSIVSHEPPISLFLKP